MQGYRVKRWHFEFTAALVKFKLRCSFSQPAVEREESSDAPLHPKEFEGRIQPVAN